MDLAKPTFDLAELDTADEADMIVMSNGSPTNWVWTFAGPGHPQAVAQSNRVAREQLSKARAKEQAQTNGKKWKGVDQSPEEVIEDNISFVTERLLRWSPVTMGGADFPFSAENARRILADRKKGALLQQAIEFIFDENSFTQRSATN